MEQKKLIGLEICRGIAAILVVIAHSATIASEQRYFNQPILQSLPANLGAGVDFFFVLSGFIIYWVHGTDIGQPTALPRYLSRRFFRIYPIYWLVLLPLIILYLAFPAAGLPEQRDPLNVVCSILLSPCGMPPVLGVAWTLVHEIFFYLVFALLISIRQKMIFIFPLWAISILLGQALLPRSEFPLSFILNPCNLDFIAGVALAAWITSHRVFQPFAILLMGVLFFFGMALFANNVHEHLLGRFVFGGASIAIIAGIVELERQGLDLSPKRPWVLLGSASYALYIVHPVVISFSLILIFKWLSPDIAAPLPWMPLLVGVSVLSGIALHLIIERPLNAGLSRWRKQRKASDVQPKRPNEINTE